MQIERFLRQTGLSPTTFGRRAAQDPRLVFDLRNGRAVGDKLSNRICRWMQENGL